MIISPYLIILFFLIFFTFLSECSKDIEKISFPLFFLFLTLFLAFRYGQGTDFFGYGFLFNQINSISDAIENPFLVHSEIGMRFLYAIFDNYLVFNFFIALFSMVMLFNFLIKYNFNRNMALLFFFHTCYLTYYFSSIRQSLALSIFIGIMLNLLINGQFKKYILWCLIASCFHRSAIILLFLPYISSLNISNVKKMIIICILCGFAVYILGSLNFIPLINGWTFNKSGFALLSYFERLISLFIVMKLADSYFCNNEDPFSKKLLNLYIWGSCLYFAFWCLESISRLCIYFKVLECFLVPYYLWKSGRKQYLYVSFLSLIVVVMTIKNIASYINQGAYYPDVTIFNYPYVSIFDPPSEIFEYRAKTIFVELLRAI